MSNYVLANSFWLTIRLKAYIAGESYAGQYIPYFADAILDSKLKVPLKGIAIGNGWMDARRQYPAYLDYAVKHGIVDEGTDVCLPTAWSTTSHNSI